MDRSYREKLMKAIEDKRLTPYIVGSCIVRIEEKIKDRLIEYKRYHDNYRYDTQLLEWMEYRKPFVQYLYKNGYNSPEKYKELLVKVRLKDIPTKDLINQIRQMLVDGSYEESLLMRCLNEL